ncbi:unnamed protein product [Hermetia illucens]|uniref:Uncharacterized protein n=1 Tax=Hermetia illucens TaxID=343691 RepID=A0A7R8UBJ7_HERIL|nr:uncharacterized protein LOC119652314 [Hermetia illucens]CAD7077735.1 unnamed protein product [Hermetia illucens]
MANKNQVGALQKIWRYRKLLIIEPLLICVLLPFGLLSVTVMNFSLEKACRVNLGYDPSVCQILLNKKQNKIDCTGITAEDTQPRNTSLLVSEFDSNINETVCKAEIESQKLVAFMNAIRGPISSFFPIIVILFAGGWSDRNGLRKPCMALPLMGAVFSITAHIVSAVFMDAIPMEFDAIMERVIPSMFGGHMLFHVGIYSYLTETTPEKDRSFRFGIFTVFLHIMLLIGVSLSGLAYNHLGYIKVFVLCDVIFASGIIYVIFFIPEIKRKDDINEIADNKEIFTFDTCEPNYMPGETAKSFYSLVERNKKKGLLADFFDPTSVYECSKVFLKKRDNRGNLFLNLSIILTILIAAPDDQDFIYLFAMKSLKWNGDAFSAFMAYSMVIMMIGTFLMTAVFIKIFGISNPMAGFLVSFLSVISNFIKAFSNTSLLFYSAATINLFSHCKGIVINAIVSEFIDKEEIGKVFSILGITAALSRSVFPLLYSFVYGKTLETFPGAIFLMSEIFLIPSTILFGIIHFMIKNHKKKMAEKEKGVADEKPFEGKNETNTVKSES